MVSAFAARERLVLGQIKVDGKSNEITTIPRLLAMMDIEGTVVTVHPSKAIVEIGPFVDQSGSDDAVIWRAGNRVAQRLFGSGQNRLRLRYLRFRNDRVCFNPSCRAHTSRLSWYQSRENGADIWRSVSHQSVLRVRAEYPMLSRRIGDPVGAKDGLGDDRDWAYVGWDCQ